MTQPPSATAVPAESPVSAEPRPTTGEPRAEAVEPPPSLPDFSDPSWTRVTSRAGKYLVCWRSTTGRVVGSPGTELEFAL